MESPNQWMPARTVRDELRAAGLGEGDLFPAIARACLSGRMVATGFRHVHGGGNSAAASDRRRVSNTLWRVFERVDPGFDLDRPEARRAFQRFVGWDGGEFTWTREQGESWTQETWGSVLFDRPLFDLWIAEVRSNDGNEVLQDHEIRGWIERDCTTENSRKAWDLFKREFGERTGKKTSFVREWGAVKGHRGRGRPKLN